MVSKCRIMAVDGSGDGAGRGGERRRGGEMTRPDERRKA